jgi:hypothetical protein
VIFVRTKLVLVTPAACLEAPARRVVRSAEERMSIADMAEVLY